MDGRIWLRTSNTVSSRVDVDKTPFELATHLALLSTMIGCKRREIVRIPHRNSAASALW